MCVCACMYVCTHTCMNCVHLSIVDVFHRYLVPPTTSCVCCHASLSLHNDPVSVRCFSLNGSQNGIKLTLRCKKCKLNYNYSQYGNVECGYHYYDKPRNYVEASDVTYLERELCHLFTSFA